MKTSPNTKIYVVLKTFQILSSGQQDTESQLSFLQDSSVGVLLTTSFPGVKGFAAWEYIMAWVVYVCQFARRVQNGQKDRKSGLMISPLRLSTF